jgi:hypothetical protein
VANITRPDFGWAIKLTDTDSGTAQKFAAELTRSDSASAITTTEPVRRDA